jgi:hypothetical protein
LNKSNVKDGEIDLSEDSDDSNTEMIPMSGKHKYDTLIKSMIARIEFSGNLAPITEYAKH